MSQGAECPQCHPKLPAHELVPERQVLQPWLAVAPVEYRSLPAPWLLRVLAPPPLGCFPQDDNLHLETDWHRRQTRGQYCGLWHFRESVFFSV